MCGITGLISLDHGKEIDRSLLQKMTDSLAHRGPDGQGTWTGDGAGLGHRRLAIIDIDGGAQPWILNDNKIVFVYNGELYNYLELREELQAEGISFQSQCDTEVALKALVTWGTEKSLEKFRGMFAFALWESDPRRLTLARDPLGVKPLYWAMREGIVRFGSEIKTILADPSFPRYPDPIAVTNYLAHYRLSFNGKTFFKNINEVPPGSFILWEGKRRRRVNYWSIPKIREADKHDDGPEIVADGFRNRLVKAVKRRMLADVPVGAYLSGGIDSSVLVYLMHALMKKVPETFSIGFQNEGYNEFPYASRMANYLQVPHHQVTLTEQGYFKQLEDLIKIKDTPLSVPNEVPLRFLSKILKKKITVVLSGEGADELMGGYTQLVRSPHDYLIAKAVEEGGNGFDSGEIDQIRNGLQHFYGTSSFSSQKIQFLNLYQWMPPHQRQVLAGEGLIESNAENTILDFWDNRWADLDASGLDPYEKVLHILEGLHLSALLLRLDATTMAEGVEGRVPYTDRDLVEWVFSLPIHYKIRWKGPEEEKQASRLTSIESAGKLDQNKYLLRLAFAGSIPDEILLRPKRAFPVPLDNWLYGTWQNWALERILTPRMGLLFNLEETEKLVRSARSKDEGMKIWMLANLGIWLESYFS